MQRQITDNRETKVSVIIPSYNSGKYLEEAIISAVNQTYKNTEIIIVNDGSTDSTEEIVKSWQRKDRRIRYVKHEKNRGLAAARNTGIKNSQGSYIAFLDADDVWLPQKLEVQMRKIEETGADLVFSNWYIWEPERKLKIKAFNLSPVQSNKKDLLFFFIKKNLSNPSTALLKKSSLEKVGLFDESLRSSEDYDLWIRFLLEGMEITFIQEPLIYYREHQWQMSKNIYKMRLSRLTVYKKVVKRNPWLVIKYPILIKKIILLQGYKFIQDLLKAIQYQKKLILAN